MQNDLQSAVKPKVERFYETIEIPAEIAKLPNRELYDIIRARSIEFQSQVRTYCVLNGIVDENRKRMMEDQMAVRQGLAFYKGYWIEPCLYIPTRFKQVVDECMPFSLKKSNGTNIKPAIE